MVVPMPIAMPSTAAMIGLTLWGERIKEFCRVRGARRIGVEVPSFRKSSRSLPAVKTPEPPVTMRQRISGLFCAVSIASLMPRYISWVMAFFFFRPPQLITRAAPSSVTIRCPVMMQSLENRRPKPPLASLRTISYIMSAAPQTGRAGFQR